MEKKERGGASYKMVRKRTHSCFKSADQCYYNKFSAVQLSRVKAIRVEVNSRECSGPMVSNMKQACRAAAGADPSRCNSTNNQNPHIHQNCCNFEPIM